MSRPAEALEPFRHYLLVLAKVHLDARLRGKLDPADLVQQWPFDPKMPDGAWGFHETLIPNSPKKPLRVSFSVGDRDLLKPGALRNGMHDWVEANHRMAKVLKAKAYDYQYLFCRNSDHGVGNAKVQFLPHAIEWVWEGYSPKPDK